ncbi:MAG TPA: cysteine--tRNA ligase [bacterium]|nr:cysteine--tRNA ligase [bacterium]
MSIRYYNTMTRCAEEFIPLVPGTARMYTCGPTVYNFPHIGNFRAYVFEDLLRRHLTYRGYAVTQVMNLTDVDDKTIRGANAQGVPLAAYTQPFVDGFFADLAALNIDRAEHYPRATGHIPEMLAIIEKLMARGIAYRADDGSVYFSIEQYLASGARYGRLVKLDFEQQRASGRVNHDEYEKETVADFALWKAYSADDGAVVWDSPWGKGRPGWHIECSAMAMKYLGPTFDLHTGGVDNAFPHHENEIAQSEAANGVPFVRYWLHCAHLMVEGEKMAKSKGNFYTLRDLLAKGHDPLAVRYLLLSAHYRMSLNFTMDGLAQAHTAVQRLQQFRARLDEPGPAGETAPETAAALTAAGEKFGGSLDDDLNISPALAAVFDLMRHANARLDADAPETERAALRAAFDRFDTVLGVMRPAAVAADPEAAAIDALVAARQAARKAKNFAESDRLRAELTRRGIVVEDTPKGPRWHRA